MLSPTELISVCLKFYKGDKKKQEGGGSETIYEEKKTIIDKMDQIIDESTSMAGMLIRVVF